MYELNLDKYKRALQEAILTKDIGKVIEVKGLLIKAYVPACSLGSICEVYSLTNQRKFFAEVVGFEGQKVLMMALGDKLGIGLGSKVVLLKSKATLNVGDALLGRVINGLGDPIDDGPGLILSDEVPLYSEAETPMKR